MIYVVTHKKVKKVKKENYSYILVNTLNNQNLKNTFEFNDLEKENISNKNTSFCELTAAYWIWKNRKKDGFVGIEHYRRFLSLSKTKKDILNRTTIEKILIDYDFILPKKFSFNCDLYHNYFSNGNGLKKDLDVLINFIKIEYPKYYPYLLKHLNEKEGHFCNIFICKDDLYDNYCSWLFDILFKIEKQIDISTYNFQEKRVFGYLSELLLDVFIATNNYKFVEYDVYFVKDKLIKKFISKIKKGIKNVF